MTAAKIRKNLRLSPKINEALVRYAKEQGETETRVVEQALQAFLPEGKTQQEQLADLLLQKYDEKYQAYMTRVRLACRGADENLQILLEVVNTLLYLHGIKGSTLFPTDKMEHSLLQSAKQIVRERIARYKQAKDFQKGFR